MATRGSCWEMPEPSCTAASTWCVSLVHTWLRSVNCCWHCRSAGANANSCSRRSRGQTCHVVQARAVLLLVLLALQHPACDRVLQHRARRLCHALGRRECRPGLLHLLLLGCRGVGVGAVLLRRRYCCPGLRLHWLLLLRPGCWCAQQLQLQLLCLDRLALLLDDGFCLRPAITQLRDLRHHLQQAVNKQHINAHVSACITSTTPQGSRAGGVKSKTKTHLQQPLREGPVVGLQQHLPKGLSNESISLDYPPIKPEAHSPSLAQTRAALALPPCCP
jgi:hypothetical protein